MGSASRWVNLSAGAYVAAVHELPSARTSHADLGAEGGHPALLRMLGQPESLVTTHIGTDLERLFYR